jgi:hypothetical protein
MVVFNNQAGHVSNAAIDSKLWPITAAMSMDGQSTFSDRSGNIQ